MRDDLELKLQTDFSSPPCKIIFFTLDKCVNLCYTCIVPQKENESKQFCEIVIKCKIF